MANINVTIRMDEELKRQADELFADLGLSLNAALTIFVKQSVREQRIPFEISRKCPSAVSDEIVSGMSKEFLNRNKSAYEELAK